MKVLVPGHLYELRSIRHLNDKVSCRENSIAITKLEEALHWLGHRTRDRMARGAVSRT